MGVCTSNGVVPDVVRVHCLKKSTLEFFQASAKEMAARLPSAITVEFARWEQHGGGEKLHNRYVLTDVGGVSLGVGIDVGAEGETDDLLLLPEATYDLRWSQYVDNDGAFTLIDSPASIKGLRP